MPDLSSQGSPAVLLEVTNQPRVPGCQHFDVQSVQTASTLKESLQTRGAETWEDFINHLP